MNPVILATGYTACLYLVDVLLAPVEVARLARRVAVKDGRPLLNAGAGTPSSSVRARVFGATLWGDVNVDLQGRGPHGPRTVSYGDVCDLSEWPDGYFGAAIASHVLEHVTDPEAALRELTRVAGTVFLCVPHPAAPHTWLHPGHRWYIDRQGRFHRLWSDAGEGRPRTPGDMPMRRVTRSRGDRPLHPRG